MDYKENRNMKKICRLILSLLMIVSVAGCTSNSEKEQPDKDDTLKIICPTGAPSLSLVSVYEDVTKEGNIDFVCIGESEDIYGNKCGVFQAVSDSTLIFRSPGHFNNFDYFISKAEYDDLCKEYGLKSMSRALNGETFKGMPIALFIIARGNPSSTRRIETKYGNTEILVYEMTDGYTSYIFKNGKLSATDENYY